MKISTLFRRSLLNGFGLITLGLLASPAHAGWIGFVVSNGQVGLANKSARVWEQISVQPGAPVLYQFLVQNISGNGAPIDGVFFGVGAAANALAGGMWFASAPGGADALFPAAPAAPCVATPCNGGQPLWNNANGGQFLNGAPMGWGFEEFDDRNIATAPFPNTAYLIRWYMQNPALGVPGGAIPVGGVRYFWLTSNFGPVPGGGGIDPLGPESIIGFDDGGGSLLSTDEVFQDSPVVTECGSGCDVTDFSFTEAPEPATASMFGLGIALAAGWAFRRRRAEYPRR